MYTDETRNSLINLLDSGATTEDILGALLSLDKMKGINVSQLLRNLSTIAMREYEGVQLTDKNDHKIFWKQMSEKFTELQNWVDVNARILNEEHRQ